MKKKEVVLQIPVTQEFKEELVKEAKEKGLTMASHVRLILIERNK